MGKINNKFKAIRFKLDKETLKTFGIDLIFILIGCTISAFGITCVLIPNGLSSGGLTGIVRVVQNFVPIDFSIMYYIGAFVILIVCFIFMGFKEARKIVLLSVIYPGIIFIFERLNFQLLEETDIMLAAIYFGVLTGIGSGLLFERGYSFGGSDTIAKIFHKRLLPFMSISQILLVIDSIIIISAGFIFGRNIALYALISQVIFSKVIEAVLYGFDTKLVQLEVISQEYKEIQEYIMSDIGRGVTNLDVQGAYTGESKTKVITICSPRESMLIRNHIARVDRKAFVSVVRVESVWGIGDGFENLFEHENK